MAIRITPDCEQIPINVVGSSSFGRYPKISLEKTYNMFISDEWLVDFPGYAKVLDALPNAIEGRGIFRSFRGNILIAVIDSNVYRIDSNLAPTFIGTLNTSSGEVFMDENLNYQICIVDGLNAYIYNYSLPPNLVVQTAGVLAPNGALTPNYVTYHNTFFLFGNANTTGNGAFWYAYAPDGPSTIKQQDQLALQTKPDYALAVKRIPAQASNVLVFGGSVCEVHTQTPGLVTYQRNQSFSIDYGCLSVSTIAASDTHIAWLGVNQSSSPVILVMTGQGVQRISTDGIDFVLDNLHKPEMSTAMMYTVNGHLFYHITFFYVDPERPDLSDNISLIYDFNTEKFFHISNQNLDYHPARQLVYFDQEVYFISINGGFLYRLSTDITDINEDIDFEDGIETDPNLRYEMQRIRICKSVRFPTSLPFSANQFVVTLEQGCDNLPAIQDCIVLMITEDNIRMFSESDIQLVPEHHGQEDCVGQQYRGRIDLALSKDGGETFGNYVSRQLNPVGIRKNILRWNKMGVANDLTLKLRFWSLGRFVVSNGIVDVTP